MTNPVETSYYQPPQLTPLKKAIYEQDIATIKSLLTPEMHLTPDIIKLIYAKHNSEIYAAFQTVFPDIINLKVDNRHPPLRSYVYDIINHCYPTQPGFPLDTKEIVNHYNARKDLLLYLWQQGANYNETYQHFVNLNNIAALVVLKYLQEHPQQVMTTDCFIKSYQTLAANQKDNANNNHFIQAGSLNPLKWPHMYHRSQNHQQPSEQANIDISIKHGRGKY